MPKSTLLLMAALIALSGCRGEGPAADAPAWKNSSLDQKWNDKTSQHFWWTSQGSQVVPYDYLIALEEKDSEELFATNAHFERLRYINQPKSAMNPGGLPIGLVKNDVKVDGLDIMGFSCSACHTARWTINGTDVLVEGGPGKGDMQMFFTNLFDSERQTLERPDKFDRFAKRVGGDPAAGGGGVRNARRARPGRRFRAQPSERPDRGGHRNRELGSRHVVSGAERRLCRRGPRIDQQVRHCLRGQGDAYVVGGECQVGERKAAVREVGPVVAGAQRCVGAGQLVIRERGAIVVDIARDAIHAG